MTDLRQELMRGEQWTLEVRTSDPQNPAADERWIRSDLDSGDKIATYRTGDGTDMPIYPTGTAEDTVSEAIRIEVSGQTGYVPIAPESDAEFQSRQVQHNGQRYAHHNSVSPGAGIPDSGDLQARYDARQLALSDGQSVSSWADLTGNGYNLSSVDSSPTFKSSQVDGQDAVRFDSDDLRTTWTSLSESYHIFALGQLFGTAGSGNDDTIWDGATREEFRFATDTDASGDPYKLAQQSSVTGSNSDLNVHIFDTLLRPSGNNDVLNIDGTQDVTGDLGDSASDGLTLGARYNSGSTEEKSQVDIVELLFYKKDKSANASDIRDYLDRDTSVL